MLLSPAIYISVYMRCVHMILIFCCCSLARFYFCAGESTFSLSLSVYHSVHVCVLLLSEICSAFYVSYNYREYDSEYEILYACLPLSLYVFTPLLACCYLTGVNKKFFLPKWKKKVFFRLISCVFPVCVLSQICVVHAHIKISFSSSFPSSSLFSSHHFHLSSARHRKGKKVKWKNSNFSV